MRQCTKELIAIKNCQRRKNYANQQNPKL